ncbi:MAG: hypothetical protein ACR2QH_18150 [Geminicoccaceae bacterium]
MDKDEFEERRRVLGD